MWLPGAHRVRLVIVARSDRAGYQICRFCWHHIKENLNKRCPACRRVYTDEGVEFKPLAASECVPIPSLMSFALTSTSLCFS